MLFYLGEGMEEMEFQESHYNLKDLIYEYQQYEDSAFYDDAETEEPLDESLAESQAY